MLWVLLAGCGGSGHAGPGLGTPEGTSEEAGAPERGCPGATSELGEDPRLSGEGVVVVWKAQRRLGLYGGGGLRGCWPVGLAMGYPSGHKQREGDRKTPEGWYRTSDKPSSQYYGAIAVHYPSAADAAAGVEAGAIDASTRDRIVRSLARDAKPPQQTPLGGEILIHGGGATDWTLGCVALDNPDLDVLREALAPVGYRTDVLLLP